MTLGGSGRLAVPTILLGLLLFALHGVFAVAPSAILTFFAEDVACAFPLLLCTVLLIGVCGPGRISVHRIGGAVVVYLLIGLFFSLLFDIVGDVRISVCEACSVSPTIGRTTVCDA